MKGCTRTVKADPVTIPRRISGAPHGRDCYPPTPPFPPASSFSSSPAAQYRANRPSSPVPLPGSACPLAWDAIRLQSAISVPTDLLYQLVTISCRTVSPHPTPPPTSPPSRFSLLLLSLPFFFPLFPFLSPSLFLWSVPDLSRE
jgi:hypothetical protein